MFEHCTLRCNLREASLQLPLLQYLCVPTAFRLTRRYSRSGNIRSKLRMPSLCFGFGPAFNMHDINVFAKCVVLLASDECLSVQFKCIHDTGASAGPAFAVSLAEPRQIQLLMSEEVMVCSSMEPAPFVEAPPAASTTNASGAHSYRSRSLAGAVGLTGEQKTPPPCNRQRCNCF